MILAALSFHRLQAGNDWSCYLVEEAFTVLLGIARHSHSCMDYFDCLPFIVVMEPVSCFSSAETDHSAVAPV